MISDTLHGGTRAPELVAIKPRLRGWMHLVSFEVSLCLGTLLIVSVPTSHRLAACIYAGAVSALFGSSALYHRGQWQPKASRLLERLDHAMIFVLIGGTATPLFLVCLPSSVGIPVLIALGAVLVAALLAHVVWIDAPESLITAAYVVLGCLGGVALPGVWVHAGIAAFVLVLGGGVLYIVGAILFAGYRPDPRPAVFGYHEVWHCFVCAAAAMHYVAIATLIPVTGVADTPTYCRHGMSAAQDGSRRAPSATGAHRASAVEDLDDLISLA